MAMRVVHYLNQFFGGLGGEEKAGAAPILVAGAKGPGILLQQRCPDLQVVATVVCGDNALAEHPEAMVAEILALLEPLFAGGPEERPGLLLAGPAFNAGRYGMACGAVCQAVAERFSVPVVTAMAPQNPGVEQYRRTVHIVEAGLDVSGMEAALSGMARLGRKLAAGEEVWPEEDGYLVQGLRRNVFVAESGAQRAVTMLLKKMRGEPFVTEYPMPVFDRVDPAPAIVEMAKSTIALVTSGGIVPRGNPDRIEAANAQRYGSYSLAGLAALSPTSHQTAHGGYDPTYANIDPNRVLPLDAVRELVATGRIGRLHETYYATVGNATSVANGRRFGREIAHKLLSAQVQAVIFTST